MTYAVSYTFNVTPLASLPQPPSNTGVWVVGQDSARNPALVGDCYGGSTQVAGVHVWGRAARGSGASPDYLQSGDILASFQGRGWAGSGFGTSGAVNFVANESHSAAAGGTQVEVTATRQGARSIGTTATFAIDSNGLTRLLLHNLPTSDPHEAERVWNNAGVLTVSAG